MPADATVADALCRRLQDMRTLILSGDFEALALAAEELSAHAARLDTDPPSRSELGRVRDAAARNAALLLAAGQGIRSAERRVREIRDVVVSARTYGPDGLRTPMIRRPTDERTV